MQFKKMNFHFDEHGEPLAKLCKERMPIWSPRTVLAKDVHASYFYIETERNHNHYGKMLHICRRSKDIDTDPYNCSGSPASVWTTIVQYHLDIFDGFVEVTGLEKPNVCWAGKYHPGYEQSGQPLLVPPADQLLEDDAHYRGGRTSFGVDGLRRQRVILYSR